MPYMLILGAQVVENHSVSVRPRDQAENKTLSAEEFISQITKEIADKK